METNLTFGSPGRKSQRAPRNTSAARAVRVLGLCGLLSALFSAAAGS